MTDTTVIVAGRCWDGRAENVRGHTEVVVRKGRIVACEDRADRPAGARIVDLGQAVLLPGLIDCHVHTVAGNTSSAQPALEALPVLRTLLDNGFTTVRDLGCFTPEPVTLTLRRSVDSGLVPGPRMIVAPRLMSARSGHGDHSDEAGACGCEIGEVADGVDEIIRSVRRQARQNADWIKFAATGGFSTSVDDPTIVGYSEREMRALVDTARDRRLPVAAHAIADAGVRRAVLAGVTSIEHGHLATEETLRLLAERGVALIPTQHAVTVFVGKLDDEDFWTDKADNVRRQIRTHAEALLAGRRRQVRGGAVIAFGTDAGTFDHADNWREFPALVGSGLSPLNALRAATVVAARLLGRDDLGRIAPGARADLVAVPASPFDDIDVMGHVSFVMKDGAIHRHP
ncbi:metal-dependent hydrolase family protein [Actinomadura flavalba]|uniref:metal-dependent hydrolase family protein n=1 Tax=Actinomadura flavalba TaxID=1120938 RepID=UPI0003678F4F|nr:amidohydrolase family protein [Actinomadura flavalba]